MQFLDRIYSLSAATKLGQGNVFTGVCDSVHREGGGCLPQCMLGYHPPGLDPPWDQTPWNRHPPWDHTPQTRPPWDHTHPRDHTHTPRTRPSLGPDTPGADTPPWEQTPLEQTPPRSRPPPGKQTPACGQ